MQVSHPLFAAATLARQLSAWRHKTFTLEVFPGGLRVLGRVEIPQGSRMLEQFVGWDYLETDRTLEVIRNLDGILTETWRIAIARAEAEAVPS